MYIARVFQTSFCFAKNEWGGNRSYMRICWCGWLGCVDSNPSQKLACCHPTHFLRPRARLGNPSYI